MQNVWHELKHDPIFNAVEGTIGSKLNNFLRHRNSYINRVYEIERSDNKERMIVKFYRPGRWTKEMILEEHAFLNELNEKDIPAIAPLSFRNSTLHSLNSIYYALFPKMGGRAIDEFDQESWENIGRHLARIHMIGSLHKGSKRIAWRPKSATKHHVEVLNNKEFILPNFKKSFNDTAEMFIKKADPIFDGFEIFLIHGDCHKGNLIHRLKEGIWIIDFDDICIGPPVQDLWMLLPGHIDDHKDELDWFLKGYQTFREFDMKSLKLIPALRGMRIIHFVSWLAVQSKDPHFHKHFPNTGTPKYWNETIKELQNILYNEL